MKTRMGLVPAQQWWKRWNAWERAAVLAWLTVFLIVAGRSLLTPARSHNTYPTFANSARNWMGGQDLYRQHDALGWYDDFRYSPIVAVSLVPISLLPDGPGGVLWRLINLGALLGAAVWWARSAALPFLQRNHLALLLILLLPLSAGNVNNGQSNPLVLGLLLAAVAGVSQERWNLAACFLAVACLFKVYPIALGLLLVALYPRQLPIRLGLALAVGLLLPFLLQRPDYVARQYSVWLDYLLSENRDQLPITATYRDLRLLVRAWYRPLSPHVYMAIQLVTAAGAALACLAGQRRGWSSRRLLPLLLGLGCCWMTVFGVATESATYILLGPTVAWGLLEAWLGRRWVVGGLFLSSYGLFVASKMANWFPCSAYVHGLGVQPLAGLILLAGLLSAEIGRRSLCPQDEPPAAEPFALPRRPAGWPSRLAVSLRGEVTRAHGRERQQPASEGLLDPGPGQPGFVRLCAGGSADADDARVGVA